MCNRAKKILLSTIALQMCPQTALAAESAGAINSGDTAWMMLSAALVLLMVPGLSLFYGGMVRSKNVLGTMMHSYVALAIIGVEWVVVGYTLAFGPDIGGFVGGLEHIMLSGITLDSVSGSIPEYIFIMFQGMFAVITPALIAGAFAERIKFSAYCLFILFWALLVYNPVAHWVWGEGGWLLEMGALDFAGGTVVHITAGVSGLATLGVIGSRRGFMKSMFIPHNLTMTLLGTGLLWFGWFGFNAGSALAANGSAALAFINTFISPAAGALSWMLIEWWAQKHPSALGVASGIVAGLVAITPAAGFVEPQWAMVIGLLSGILCYYSVAYLKVRYRYDDSLDAFGIHGVGGTWGAIATGIFATVGAGSLITGDTKQFLVQLVGIVASAIYAYVMTWIIFTVIDKLIGVRVDDEEELKGLDQTQHSEVGYSF